MLDGAAQTVRAVYVFDVDVLRIGCVRRILGTLDDKDTDTGRTRRLDLLGEAAAKTAFLGQDGLRLQLFQQLPGVIVFVVHQVVFGELRLAGEHLRERTVEDAHPALMPLPVGPQRADVVYARQGQQMLDTLGLKLRHGILIVLAPDHVLGAGRIDAVVADDGRADMTGHEEQVAVQLLGERVGGVDEEADAVLAAALNHLRNIHVTLQVHAVHQFNLLAVAAGGIVVAAARLLEHLHGLAALRRSSEDQYHLYLRFDDLRFTICRLYGTGG